MAEWLVLQLPRSLEQPCGWMLADAQGQPQSTPESGTLAQAAAVAAGRRIAAVVPSSDVLITEVDLPVKSGARAQQVVAYALEEQLAADIESLHFALGARNPRSARSPVAVVTRLLLQQWLDALTAAGLTPEALCPEAALLPDNPGHTVVMLDGDTLCVRRSGHTPLALPAGDIATALAATLGTAMAADNLIVYASPPDWQRCSREVEALRSHCASLKVQLLHSGALPLLSPPLAGGVFLNWLSGTYAPKRPPSQGWQRWRLAAVLALALFVVHVGGLSLELLQQRRNESALDAAIGALARSAMPGDTGRGTVRARVERRLLAAQSQSSNAGLLPALAALAQALGGGRDASVQARSYRDGGLDLKLRAGDAASLERIDQALRNSGWQAELTAGNAVGTAYEGRIQIRPPDAPQTTVQRPR